MEAIILSVGGFPADNTAFYPRRYNSFFVNVFKYYRVVSFREYEISDIAFERLAYVTVGN
jgi:hypothetical protein